MTAVWITAAALAYLTGYVTGVVTFIRHYDWRTPRCHRWSRRVLGDSERECRQLHASGCWRTGPQSNEDLPTFLLPLLWPVLLIPYVAYRIAMRPRREVLLDLRRVAELEREAGIGDDR